MSKMTSPVFRGSFVALTTPSIPPGGSEEDAKFAITMVLEHDEPFVAKLRKECERVAKEKFGNQIKFSDEKKKGHVWLPFRDGDESEYAEHQGHTTIQATSKRRPEVVEKGSLAPVIDADRLFSGAAYRISCNAYAWEWQGTRGVSISLGNVMLVDDTLDAYDGRTSAADDFSDFADEEGDNSLLD